METFATEQAVALASLMLLMVLAGLTKGRLEWQPRRRFWRRRRR
jgi:hypothetical protein